jgi:hypothetical protein
MKRLGSSLLFVILAACGGSSPPPPAAPEPEPAVAPAPAVATATCETTVDKMMAMMSGDAFDPVPADRRDHWKRRFTEVMTAACREDGWPQPVLDCAGKAETEPALEACAEGLGDVEEEKLQGRIQALITELTADAAPPSEPPAPPPSSSSSSTAAASDAAVITSGLTSIAACDEYVAVFDAYLACDKVPPQVVEASKQGIDAMKHAWADLRGADVPREARQAASDACRQGTDALKESAAALGCAMALPPAPPPAKAKPKKTKKGAKAKKGE